ncbi:hypothetical protein C8Q72DRAFT_869531, partial [Fomitopsis betulina]
MLPCVLCDVPELEDDAPIATAQDAEAVSQSTRAPRSGRSSEPAASKSSGKDKVSNHTKSSVSGSAKASAAATKKQKQAEEKRRQQEIQEQNAAMLQDEEPGSGVPEGASHDESSQPDAGPSKKMAVKVGPPKKGMKRPAAVLLEQEVSEAEGQSSRKTKGKEAIKKGPQGKPALKTSRAEMELVALISMYFAQKLVLADHRHVVLHQEGRHSQ